MPNTSWRGHTGIREILHSRGGNALLRVSERWTQCRAATRHHHVEIQHSRESRVRAFRETDLRVPHRCRKLTPCNDYLLPLRSIRSILGAKRWSVLDPLAKFALRNSSILRLGDLKKLGSVASIQRGQMPKSDKHSTRPFVMPETDLLLLFARYSRCG
jgi:hypothetical protein